MDLIKEEFVKFISARLEKSTSGFDWAIIDKNKPKCSIEWCLYNVEAKGFCHVHYRRMRLGIDMQKPIENKTIKRVCVECGVKTFQLRHNRCKKHGAKYRRKIVRKLIVELFHNECSECKGKFDPVVFDFHHTATDKDKAIATYLAGSKLENLYDELSKCVMLCANCHRLEHHGDRSAREV